MSNKYYKLVVELDADKSLGESKEDISVNMLFRYIAFSESPEVISMSLRGILNLNSFEELAQFELKNPQSASVIGTLRELHDINLENPPDAETKLFSLCMTDEANFTMFKALVQEFYNKTANTEILKKNTYCDDGPRAKILEIEEIPADKYACPVSNDPTDVKILSKFLEQYFSKDTIKSNAKIELEDRKDNLEIDEKKE